jgi:accessory gene regulator B
MKELAEKLAIYVWHSGEISKEDFAIYKYGFEIGLEMTLCFVVSAVISAYLGMQREFLLFILIFIPVRTFAGGLHLHKFWSCFLLSSLVQVGVLLFSKRICFSALNSWLIIAFSMIILLLISPVETSNRKIDIEESRYFIKRVKAVFCLILILTIIFTLFSYFKYVSLIAVTMVVILGSAIAGKIKYQLETYQTKVCR